MKRSKSELFLELAELDEEGFSRKVSVDEFKGKYSGLVFGNGASWARSDGPLGKKYNIVRYQEKSDSNAITHVQLQGRNKTPKINRSIRKEIKDYFINNKKCTVLAISANSEIDHKDGRYDDSLVSNTSTQKVEDFQLLNKTVNNAKRQHCKECKNTKQRFDARILGYPIGQIKGNGVYRGSCIGCYWYDPQAFNKAMNFVP